MTTPVRIGIIREGKVPPDSRVPLVPEQAAEVAGTPEYDVAVQPSPGRCFDDAQYQKAGVVLSDDLSDRDVLLGVKEVPIDQLIDGKTYFFFSHTHKQQAYNRGLLQAVLAKRIRLIDYELLTDAQGRRLIAFGRFAGMVGAHHAMRAWGLRTGAYELQQMNAFYDYAAAKEAYAKTDWGDVRVVVTGSGRVGKGAVEVLQDMGLREVSQADFLSGEATGAVYCVAGVHGYVRRKDGAPFKKKDFYADPGAFENTFTPFAERADVMVHGIFWDNDAPAFFERADLAKDGWSIQVLADVTCDIAPVTSIPSTLKPSTIADPYFGVDRVTFEETDAFSREAITMMTVDNLPNELPRDASKSFGAMFIKHILPELALPASDILDRATIARDGRLTERYSYLEDFVAGKA